MKPVLRLLRQLMILPIFLVLASSCQSKVEQLDEHLLAGEYGQAAKLAEELCGEDVLDACDKLGEIYLAGKGVARDEKKAFDFFVKARKSGSASVYRRLGHFYEEGVAVERDLKKAREMYEYACQGDRGAGCVSLALFMQRGGPNVKYSAVEVFRTYRIACRSGEVEGCGRYDELLEKAKRECADTGGELRPAGMAQASVATPPSKATGKTNGSFARTDAGSPAAPTESQPCQERGLRAEVASRNSPITPPQTTSSGTA
ncbi:MAG: sel1 repeat family protein [Deltaproteobacteria bacterium]|nr:sel1 repeat family protein [Deltaproteobacteria bacterium]